jgi:DNA-binding MltR family transcriptional regulator
MHTQGDRSVAIVGAAYLDTVLELLLRNFLVEDENALGKLFDQDRPLSTFSARINMSYCLGLLTRSEYRELDLIRQIRNHFAHQLHGVAFDDPVISDKCRALSLIDTDIKIDIDEVNLMIIDWAKLRKETQGVEETKSPQELLMELTTYVRRIFTPRQTFITSIPLLALRLTTRMTKLVEKKQQRVVCEDKYLPIGLRFSALLAELQSSLAESEDSEGSDVTTQK